MTFSQDEKETLVLAAKACGLSLSFTDIGCMAKFQNESHYTHTWNPLNSDGDALRLAVKLGLKIETNGTAHWGHVTYVDFSHTKYNGPCETHGDDPYKATRLAIVAAAAQIGKEKNE